MSPTIRRSRPSGNWRCIDALEATLFGRSEAEAEALPLRAALAARGLGARHALDLLQAFRRDVTKNRTRDFADLIDYCTYSAMPVGRFVLDVHGEDEALWPLSDAICAGLQINNHLQDCAADYRQLDRVYVPLEDLAAHGIGPEALAAPRASPALRACLRGLAGRTRALLDEGATLPEMIADPRLGLEIAVIVRLAKRINDLLLERDPLSENVHLSKAAAARDHARRRLRRIDRPVAALSIGPPKCRGGVSMALLANATAKPAAPAAGSSFYMAMRILPRPQRLAMFEVYAFCRAVDDIADDTLGPRQLRLEQLARWRSDIGALYAGAAASRTGRSRRVPSRSSISPRLISWPSSTAWKWMSSSDITAPDWATLDLYCDRVASAVGRLSVRIFGIESERGTAARPPPRPRPSAHQYSARYRRGCRARPPLSAARSPACGRHRGDASRRRCSTIPASAKPAWQVAERAHGHFAAAAAIMARCPRSVVRAPRLMAEAYRLILARLEAQGWSPPRKRCACRGCGCCSQRCAGACCEFCADDPCRRRRPCRASPRRSG